MGLVDSRASLWYIRLPNRMMVPPVDVSFLSVDLVEFSPDGSIPISSNMRRRRRFLALGGTTAAAACGTAPAFPSPAARQDALPLLSPPFPVRSFPCSGPLPTGTRMVQGQRGGRASYHHHQTQDSDVQPYPCAAQCLVLPAEALAQ